VQSIVVDEDAHSMDIAVAEDKLSQAIGRGGQNIRLASQLTGWELNVMTEAEAEQKSESEDAALQKMFMDQLHVDEEVASILVQEGFSSIEEVAYVPAQEMLGIEEFDEEIVRELRDRARDVLLTKAIAKEEQMQHAGPAPDLLALEGMDEELAQRLAEQGVITREDLAEQAVDDIKDIAGMGQERAAGLIMKAREVWFNRAEEASDQQQ
jgi:N utilization substance protein A